MTLRIAALVSFLGLALSTSAALAARTGVDYAWDKPSPQSLTSGGYTFAARYLSYDTTGKNLTASEAKSLIAAGIDIVSNWEYATDAALDGYSQGVKDATEANKQAAACGAPADRPIYFSVDFDATPGQQTAINSYFDGVASVIGVNRAGAYGGYYVIQRLFDAGKIKWGWQTYAWSGGQWDSRAQLRQVNNGVTIGGADCDVDDGMTTDFGQWGHPTTQLGLAQLSGNDTLTAINWPDGHVELFPRSSAGDRLHVWTDAGDTWTDAVALDHDSNCGSAAGFWGTPWTYPELFSVRSDGTTGHLWWASPSWNTFQPFGGMGLSHLSTLVWGDGRVEVFGLGADGAIWHDYWNTAANDWSGWSSMGGSLATGASTILWKDGHGELFAVDAGGVAWHNYSGNFPSGWSGWQSLGGSLASRPTAVRWDDGHVELFARGTDGHLYHAFASDVWSDWQVLSAATTIVGEPSAIMNRGIGSGVGPEVFARDASGAVVHAWWDGAAWNDFTPLGSVTAASDPFGWLRGDGHGEVFAVDTQGNLTRSYRDSSGGWGAWTAIASGIDSCTPAQDTGGGPGGGPGDGTGGSTNPGGAQPGGGLGSGGHGCAFASAPATSNGAIFGLLLVAGLTLLRARRRAS